MAKKKSAKKTSPKKKAPKKKAANKKTVKASVKKTSPKKKSSKKTSPKKPNDPLRDLVRLCHTRWYIDYRRWDESCLHMIIARLGIYRPKTGGQEQSLNEDGAKLQSKLKMAYDVLAKVIENTYDGDPEFDRYYYYSSGGSGEKAIDQKGVEQIGEQIQLLSKKVSELVEGTSKSSIRKLCSLRISDAIDGLPGAELLERTDLDGKSAVVLPEFPTPLQIWNFLEHNEEIEKPDDYLFG